MTLDLIVVEMTIKWRLVQITRLKKHESFNVSIFSKNSQVVVFKTSKRLEVEHLYSLIVDKRLRIGLKRKRWSIGAPERALGTSSTDSERVMMWFLATDVIALFIPFIHPLRTCFI